MKAKFYLFTLLATLLVFSACKKDNDTQPSAGMSARIDGKNWTSRHSATVAEYGKGVLRIAGQSRDGITIELISYNGGAVGVYNKNIFVILKDSTGTQWTAQSGCILEITRFDVEKGKISGTFSFTANNGSSSTKTVTQGEFTNISLKTDVSVNPGTTDYTVQVNGSNWQVNDMLVDMSYISTGYLYIYILNSSTREYIFLELPARADRPGTYTATNSGAKGYFIDPNENYWISDSECSVTITAFDMSTKKASGSFSFKAYSSGASAKTVSGSFTNIRIEQ